MPTSNTKNGGKAQLSGMRIGKERKESTIGIRDYAVLPANARAYLERIQSLVNVPIDMISTGAERDETIVLRHPFAA